MKFLILISAFFTFKSVSISQNQANIWLFGKSNCVDFSSGSPIFIPGSSINTIEGCASYCDSNGRLILYTNGGGSSSNDIVGSIWNGNNEILYIMPENIGGGASSNQSSIIVESPHEDSVYYIFTMDEYENYNFENYFNPCGKGLSYFKIDMKKNNGKGKIIEIRSSIYAPSFEGLCAVRHKNKKDYWIIINHINSKFGVYLLDSTGLFLKSEYFFANQNDSRIVASPNGSKVIGYNLLMDFNNETGKLTNGLQIPDTENGCFSSNSKYLYVFRDDENFNKLNIIRYDLTKNDIHNSNEIIGTVDKFDPQLEKMLNTTMQLGPDGNIYFGLTDFARIKNPNEITPLIERNILSLNYSNDWSGFPNFPSWIFEKEQPSNYMNIETKLIREENEFMEEKGYIEEKENIEEKEHIEEKVYIQQNENIQENESIEENKCLEEIENIEEKVYIQQNEYIQEIEHIEEIEIIEKKENIQQNENIQENESIEEIEHIEENESIEEIEHIEENESIEENKCIEEIENNEE